MIRSRDKHTHTHTHTHTRNAMETLIAKCKQRFMAKYVQSDNVLLCQLFVHVDSV